MVDKISVIIPAYNAEKFILECLESVESQTYKNTEVIVVDDGSVDGTYNVVSEYAKAHENVVLVHQENGGVCAARNKGLDLATGEYVTFVDADDYLVKTALECLHDIIIERNVDLVSGIVGPANGNACTEIQEKMIEEWDGEGAIIKSLEDNPHTYSSCGKLFSRKAIDGVSFVVGKRIHEDSYFNFCVLMKKPKVAILEKQVYVYRDNPNSASHAKFSEKFFDILYFAEEKKKAIESQRPELLGLADNVIVKANLSLLHCFCRTKDKKYNKAINSAIKAVRKNAKSFVPAIKTDKRFFNIVKWGLYRLYRKIYWIKYPISKE